MESSTPVIELPTHGNFKNFLGQVFERLTVKSYAGKRGKCHYWLCLCECGNEKTIKSGHLKDGTTLSCRCLAKENTRTRETKHGQSYSRIYGIWNSMIGRCLTPTHHAYKDYGGRGITTCKGWQAFDNFFADMGERPTHRSLDRIDNSKGYWCGHCDECLDQGRTLNCRWATKSEQQRNMRSNRILSFRGESCTVTEWAEKFGLPPYIVFTRLRKGWDFEKTFTTPIGALSRGGIKPHHGKNYHKPVLHSES